MPALRRCLFNPCCELHPTALLLSTRPTRTVARAPSTKASDSARARRVNAAKEVAALPWRVFLSSEELLAIDLLTFELGKYPEQRLPQKTLPPLTPQSTAPASSSTALSPPPSTPTMSASKKVAARSKFASLDALQARHQREPMPSKKTEQEAHGRGSAAAAPSRSRSRADVPTEAIHPITPFRVVEQLVAEALAADGDCAEDARGGAAASYTQSPQDARKLARAWQRATTHPPDIFSNEAQVLHHFGMGGSTSPSAPGFHGLFRQQWQDFHVTEMVADAAAPLGGSMVSRDLDFTIPPLPEELLRQQECEAEAGEGRRSGGDARRTMTVEQEDKEADDHLHSDRESSRPDQSFFEVDVAAQLAAMEKPEVDTTSAHRPPSMKEWEDKEAALMREVTDRHRHHSARFYLQCTLHKQHVAHSVALATIAQTLRVHPRAISVAGIKDFIGDTIQRIRVENVSPSSALQANAIFHHNAAKRHRGGAHRPLNMTLSDFSYETAPLAPGDLFGNHFRIVLRDVTAPKADIDAALTAFAQRGFPNYYGCQRFSWFGGTEDAAFALLRHNWLAFAFRFLNFTAQDRSLRELLQRDRKYPHAVQDEYRRNVVRRLRQIAVEPSDLDEAPFQSCPPLNETSITGAGGGPLNTRQELILWQLREAYFDLHAQSRRLTAQRLSSYLWNQVLTLRLHHFGGEQLLDGDHVAPAALRRAASTVWDRKEWHQAFHDVITSDNRGRYSIANVVHPGFSFEGIQLPENPVGTYYQQVCEKYHLDWQARHSRAGIADFREPPRPIVRHPLDLSYTYDQSHQKLTVSFALERGCYANVAITELMKLARCAGSEAVTVLPVSDTLWDVMGERDPGYVTALQDIYRGYEDGVGFTGDSADIAFDAGSERKVWELEGPLFLAEREDPFRQAHRWGSRNLLRNAERREKDRAATLHQLFEAPLARKIGEAELGAYAGHTVPLMPNARGKRTFFKVLRRNQRYAGAPRVTPRLQRGAQKPNRSHKLPAFKTLSKGTWNVSW